MRGVARTQADVARKRRHLQIGRVIGRRAGSGEVAVQKGGSLCRGQHTLDVVVQQHIAAGAADVHGAGGSVGIEIRIRPGRRLVGLRLRQRGAVEHAVQHYIGAGVQREAAVGKAQHRIDAARARRGHDAAAGVDRGLPQVVLEQAAEDIASRLDHEIAAAVDHQVGGQRRVVGGAGAAQAAGGGDHHRQIAHVPARLHRDIAAAQGADALLELAEFDPPAAVAGHLAAAVDSPLPP